MIDEGVGMGLSSGGQAEGVAGLPARTRSAAARRRAAERLLDRATELLAASLDDYGRTLQRIVDLVVPALATGCILDLVEDDGAIRRVAVAHPDSAIAGRLRHGHDHHPIDPAGQHPIAVVARTQIAAIAPRVDDDLLARIARDDEHLAILRASNPASGMLVPLIARGKTLGVVSIISYDPAHLFDAADLRFAESFARRCALALDNARLYAREQEARHLAEAAQQRLTLLAEASRAFTGSLDLGETLQRIVRLAVPALADWCVVDLLGEDGRTIERVAAAARTPEQETAAFERARLYPPDADAPGGVGYVIRTGTPVFTPIIDEAALLDAAISPAHLDTLRASGLRSNIIAPLVARGRVIGSMQFAMADSGRYHTAESLDLTQELANRAAVAVDNARLYEDAQAGIRARDQFLAIAAHELKTPVTSIKGFAQVTLRRLERNILAPEALARALTAIDESCTRLSALTLDLLDVGRLRTGQLTLHLAAVDLRALVRRVVESFASTLDDQEQIQIDLPSVPCTAEVDEDRLVQVLMNLLDNARKYSPAGGPIRVMLRPEGDGVLLQVADEGIGLPPGSDEVIYEPFGRAPNALSMSRPGLGLGLHICRGLIERHGGRIWAESPGQDQGTTFSVWLPQGSPSTASRG